MTGIQREWTPKEGWLPALSIQQPFCQAILLGRKTIELRSWGTHYRGLLVLHAGKTWYGEREYGMPSWDTIQDIIHRLGLPRLTAEYPLSALVGLARLVGCATLTAQEYARLHDQHRSNAPWSPPVVSWVFEDVRALVVPVPYRGQPGLFGVEHAQVEAVAPTTEREA